MILAYSLVGRTVKLIKIISTPRSDLEFSHETLVLLMLKKCS